MERGGRREKRWVGRRGGKSLTDWKDKKYVVIIIFIYYDTNEQHNIFLVSGNDNDELVFKSI